MAYVVLSLEVDCCDSEYKLQRLSINNGMVTPHWLLGIISMFLHHIIIIMLNTELYW
jgi:hypothetical protein